jgi:hypothetical protein
MPIFIPEKISMDKNNPSAYRHLPLRKGEEL